MIFNLIFLTCSLFAFENDCNQELIAKENFSCSNSLHFSFGVFSDCQCVDCSSFNDPSVLKLAEAVNAFNQMDLTYAIQLGDFKANAYSGYQYLVPTFNQITTDKYHVIGNHDYDNQTTDQMIMDTLGIVAPFYDFSYYNWRFVVIETTGTLDTAQTNWLHVTLTDAVANNQKIIVFGHHPKRVDYSTVFDDYNTHIIAYMNGHNHAGGYLQDNDIHYQTFKGMLTHTNAYSRVEVYKDRLEVIGFGEENNRTLSFSFPNGIPSDILISIDTSNNTFTGTLTAMDEDLFDDHQFELVQGFGNNDMFDIQGSVLTMTDSIGTCNDDDTLVVKIKATDCDNGFVEKAFVFDINYFIPACNNAPNALPDNYTLEEDSTLIENVLTNDADPEGQPLTVTLTDTTENGALSLHPDGSFTYIPDLNYFGTDAFSYEVCDNATPALCSQETATINILAVNDLPTSVNDSLSTDEDVQVAGNASTNDFDIETSQMNYMLVTFTQNGSILFNFDGSFYYTPFAGFSGIDSFQYQACDDGTPVYCDTATVYIEVFPGCVTMDISLYLEGVYDSLSNQMSTTLNTVRAVLPGMTGNPTAGQPYNSAPWNYNGTEGTGWTDADYDSTIVDWVLISLRTDLPKSTEVFQFAGLLHADGLVSFPGECLTTAQLNTSYYIVAEHRNHMSVMSPQKIPVSNRVLAWDFRLGDSYAVGGNGAKELSTGVWGLFSGDCNQVDDLTRSDINGKDKASWLLDNGKFGVYLTSDMDMNGDVNGADKALWLLNNGVFGSVGK